MSAVPSVWEMAADLLDPKPEPEPTDPEQLSPIAFAEARSRGQWHRAPHLELIEREVLHAIETGGRLIISVSIRHGKSEFIARWLIAWFIARYRRRVILATGEADLAAAHGRAARDILTEYGPTVFGVSVSRSSNAANRWDLAAPHPGGLLAIGVGGSPIGRGGDLIVVDDPFRNFAQAMSPLERQRVKEWWTGTMVSRIEPGGAVIIICARWHEDDLSGFLLSEAPDEWREVRLPAIADSEDDPLGREVGEALWPDRYSVEELHRMRDGMSLTLGESVWLAQAQQTPQTPKGGKFPEDRWQFTPHFTIDIENDCRWVRGWDLAATEGGGDWTVGVLMGRTSRGQTIIADVQRGQWADLEVEERIAACAVNDPKGTHIELPQDPGQAGKAQAAGLVRMLAGYSVRAVPVTGSKEVRATGLAAQQQAGQVTLVEGDWNGQFVAECASFPKGRHDDQVDAAATAFEALVGGGVEVAKEEAYKDQRLKGRR